MIPSLEQLPPPPTGKAGWPWTEASPEVSVVSPLPLVSIVTPSYNQAQFIEETIRSVLLQGYPNLEYLVIDGGSTDCSIEIIRKYEPWLTYWVSEPDHGQTHAINKGFAHAHGQILAWLNSDDLYLPGAIHEAVRYLQQHSALVVYGDSAWLDAEDNRLSQFQAQPFSPPQMFFDHFVPQPSAFFRRAALERTGGLNEALHFCMDYDLWLRVALIGRLDYVPRLWSGFRTHAASKGSTLQALRWSETASILKDFWERGDVPKRWERYRSEAIGRAHWHAAVEFHRNRQRDEAQSQIEQALRFAPDYLKARALTGMLVGGLANNITPEMFTWVDDFFTLIPSTTNCKPDAHRRACAYMEALFALNDSTPRDLARRYARSALKQDCYWISNRHVLSRAFR